MQNSTQAANAWRILFLLFLANLFNFFDRTIPAIIIEPIRMEWHLSDFQLGIIGTAFTIVYAIAGLPLGRMADTGSRSKAHGLGPGGVEWPDGGQRSGGQFLDVFAGAHGHRHRRGQLCAGGELADR